MLSLHLTVETVKTLYGANKYSPSPGLQMPVGDSVKTDVLVREYISESDCKFARNTALYYCPPLKKNVVNHPSRTLTFQMSLFYVTRVPTSLRKVRIPFGVDEDTP